jgi:GNAT superfamily N-acetyltransferase
MMICTRHVDPDDERDTLLNLNWMIFGDTAPRIEPEEGEWWIAYDGDPREHVVVGFGGCRTARGDEKALYLCRAGVVPAYRGLGIQRKLIKERERFARAHGYERVITDCTSDNIASANTLIKTGFKLWKPPHPWAFATSLYWKKEL